MKLLKKTIKVFLLIALLFGIVWYALSLRKPLFQDVNYATALLDKNGKLLSATISADEQWHFKQQGEISDKYIQAVVTFEDKRFYRHIGFDLKALCRAIRLNIKHKRIVSGGSTISMQTIRLNQGNPPRNISNKILELVLATRLELKHSKEEILNLYASHAPFGGNVVGIDAACWRYFNKSPENISWAEASLLAVLPNSPGLIHTERNRKKLKSKRDKLLLRLKEKEIISEIAYKGALIEEIPRRARQLPQDASHFLNFARKKTNRSIIHSTIDPIVQQKCNEIARTEGRKLKTNFIDNLSILVLDLENQSVVSYVGNLKGTGLNNQEYTDMIQAQRSTGSVLKPFLYASSLDNGLITEKSFLPDYPFSMNGFITKNYIDEHTGLINANQALQKSLNIPFSYLLQQYGVEKFRLLCQDLKLYGINKSSDYYGIPLILGGAESSLWDITHAYASIGNILKTYNENNGYYETEPIYRSKLLQGEKLSDKQKLISHAPLLKAENIWLTFQNLKKVNRPSAEGEWEQFSSSIPISWKTGTSNGFKDAWAIGVNGKYAIGVWVGNSDGEGRPGIVGLKAAAPIFFRIVNSLSNHKTFDKPIDDLELIAACSISGELATANCPVDTLLISSSSKYLKACEYHEEILTDESRNFIVFKNCYSDSTISKKILNMPIQVAYYYKRKNVYSAPPPIHPNCLNQAKSSLDIIYPENNMQIYQPKIGNNERNKFILTAHHSDENAVLHWHLDQKFLGSTQKIHELGIQLEKGTHRLIVLDQNGSQKESIFEIL